MCAHYRTILIHWRVGHPIEIDQHHPYHPHEHLSYVVIPQTITIQPLTTQQIHYRCHHLIQIWTCFCQIIRCQCQKSMSKQIATITSAYLDRVEYESVGQSEIRYMHILQCKRGQVFVIEFSCPFCIQNEVSSIRSWHIREQGLSHWRKRIQAGIDYDID